MQWYVLMLMVDQYKRITTTISNDDHRFIQEHELQYNSILKLGIVHARKIFEEIEDSITIDKQFTIKETDEGESDVLHQIIAFLSKSMKFDYTIKQSHPKKAKTNRDHEEEI